MWVMTLCTVSYNRQWIRNRGVSMGGVSMSCGRAGGGQGSWRWSGGHVQLGKGLSIQGLNPVEPFRKGEGEGGTRVWMETQRRGGKVQSYSL